MDLLIKNGTVVTCNDKNEVLEDVCISIKDGIIESIDSIENIDESKYKRVIDAKNKIVMPGLVNAHTHSGMSIFRNFTQEMPLEEWLFDNIFPVEAKLTKEDIHYGTMLSIAEMIKGGTTTFADMYYYMDEVASLVEKTGIRANLSKSVLSLNQEGVGSISRDLEGTKEYFKRWHNSCDGRIKVYIEIHSAYIYDEPSIRETAELAKDLGTGIHIHVAETENEQEVCKQKYGMDVVSILDKCKVFDVPVLAAHCVHLSDENIMLLKKKNVNVCHNITSNLKLGSGIARIPDMLNKGVNISLGTDGCASNDNLNMFEEIHLTSLVHKGIKKDPTVAKASDVLRMATVNGAKALGFDNLGFIEKGAIADIIIIDTDNIHNIPVGNPINSLAYSIQASDVNTTIVNGKVLMEDRVLTTIDEEMLRHEINKVKKRLIG